LKYSRIDPSNTDNRAIKTASESGHAEIVTILLKDSRVNPKVHCDYPIRCASRNGHTAVVKVLLRDSRVDPSAQGNEAIICSSQNEHLEVVKILLQDSRVDPTVRNNYALLYAFENDHIEIVKLLIPRVDLTKITNRRILDIVNSVPTNNSTPIVNFAPIKDSFFVNLFSQLDSRNISNIRKDGNNFFVEYRF
jgi:ankyrin repeat protein